MYKTEQDQTYLYAHRDDEGPDQSKEIKTVVTNYLKQIYKKIYKDDIAKSVYLKKMELILDPGEYSPKSNSNKIQDKMLKMAFVKKGEDQIENDSEILRTNFEMCIETNYCDHIVDILNMHLYNNSGKLVHFKS